jgi:phage-related protein
MPPDAAVSSQHNQVSAARREPRPPGFVVQSGWLGASLARPDLRRRVEPPSRRVLGELKYLRFDGISYPIYNGAVDHGLQMAKTIAGTQDEGARKPLVWLHGEIKTPPFTAEGRQEAGMLLRLLQQGQQLSMPQAEPLPNVGARCGALRVRDAGHNWRIMYRADADAVLVLDVYSKKTRKIPDEVVSRCQDRLKRYDAAVRMGKKK